MPGIYSVDMALWSKGELIQLSESVSFEVSSLQNTSIPASNLAEVETFNQQISNMLKAYDGTSKLLGELTNKLETIKQTVFEMNNAPQSLLNEARELSVELEGINFKMKGVPAKASWEEVPPAQMPINRRVNAVAYARSGSTGDVTQTELQTYEIVSADLQKVIEQLKQIVETKLPTIEANLNKFDAPWTPGRVIELKK
jgi:archaellum component FlaC